MIDSYKKIKVEIDKINNVNLNPFMHYIINEGYAEGFILLKNMCKKIKK